MKDVTVVAIGGRARAGKSTLAQAIKDHGAGAGIPVIVRGLADSLKEEVASLLSLDCETIDADKETFRPLLQWWGDYRKMREYGGGGFMHWCKEWVKGVIRASARPLIDYNRLIVAVPDVRYPYELAYLRTMGDRGEFFSDYKLVSVYVNAQNAATTAHTSHSSENSVGPEDFQAEFVNFHGDPNWERRMKAFVKSLLDEDDGDSVSQDDADRSLCRGGGVEGQPHSLPGVYVHP